MLVSTLRAYAWLLLAGAPLAACTSGGAEDAPAGVLADRPAFAGGEAHALLVRQVEFGPRVPGSEGHRAQLEWMREWLTERADTVVVQAFAHTASDGAELPLANLFASFQPERDDRILLLAHWDTRPRADQAASAEERARPVPGANDGASGTAILLQLAELFARRPPPVGVDLLFVDGEDYGPGSRDMYIGARYFAENLPEGYRPLYGILLDMVGDRDLRLPIEGNSQQYAPEVVQRVWAVAQELGYGDVFLQTQGGYITDDHIPLNQAGIRTIDIIDFDYGPGNRWWHTPDDTPDKTSAESLEIVGEVVAELVYRGG